MLKRSTGLRLKPDDRESHATRSFPRCFQAFRRIISRRPLPTFTFRLICPIPPFRSSVFSRKRAIIDDSKHVAEELDTYQAPRSLGISRVASLETRSFGCLAIHRRHLHLY